MDKHKKGKIIFITLFYPYTHKGVSYDFYVEEEIRRLSENFEVVDIISLSTGHDGQLPVPANVKARNLNLQPGLADKFALLKCFFRSFFWQELKNLKTIYGLALNIPLLKAICIYAARAIRYSAFLEQFLQENNAAGYDTQIYSYWNLEYALASVLLKEKYPVKTVVRTHSLDLYFDRMPENYQPFKKFTYEKADLFVFISEQGMNYFFEKHKIPVSRQNKNLLNRIGIKNEQGAYALPYNKIVLLSNAWIQPLKRIDLLVKALTLLDNIEIEWIHIGDDYGTGRMPALQKLAANLLDNKKNINYELAGRKSKDELFNIYRAKQVNLFINLSTTEGTPVSMMEALSFGVPVIGTAVGGVPEIVEEGVNGFLLPPAIEEREVAARIREYFLLPVEKKEQLSANAKRIWNEKYNASLNSKALLEKIMSL